MDTVKFGVISNNCCGALSRKINIGYTITEQTDDRPFRKITVKILLPGKTDQYYRGTELHLTDINGDERIYIIEELIYAHCACKTFIVASRFESVTSRDTAELFKFLPQCCDPQVEPSYTFPMSIANERFIDGLNQARLYVAFSEHQTLLTELTEPAYNWYIKTHGKVWSPESIHDINRIDRLPYIEAKQTNWPIAIH